MIELEDFKDQVLKYPLQEGIEEIQEHQLDQTK